MRWRRIRLAQLDDVPDPVGSVVGRGARCLIEDLTPEAVSGLLVAHPLVVTPQQAGRRRLVSGEVSYGVARTVLGLDARVTAIEVADPATAKAARAADRLLAPTLLAPVPTVSARRWRNAAERGAELDQIGFQHVTSQRLARYLDVSSSRLYRLLKATSPNLS